MGTSKVDYKKIKEVYLVVTGTNDTHFNRVKKLQDLLDSSKCGLEELCIVICGHSGFSPENKVSEASRYLEYFNLLEEKSYNLILEEQSLDTLGNAYFSCPIVKEIIAGSTNKINFYFISEHYHLQRCKWIFSKVYNGLLSKMNVKRCSAKNNEKFAPHVYTKEFLLLLLLKFDFMRCGVSTYDDISSFMSQINMYKNLQNNIRLKKSAYATLVNRFIA